MTLHCIDGSATRMDWHGTLRQGRLKTHNSSTSFNKSIAFFNSLRKNSHIPMPHLL